MCGLSRAATDTFVVLGADTRHFAGALRPSAFIPLPDELGSEKFGLDSYFPCPCPCSLFGDRHPGITESWNRCASKLMKDRGKLGMKMFISRDFGFLYLQAIYINLMRLINILKHANSPAIS